MADIGRAASHHAQISTSPGWGDIDQALTKLNVRSDKDKHLRLDTSQRDLHVHDSQGEPHGLGSPKKKFGRAVAAIKGAIDRDFGAGAGDKVFRQIGIKSDNQGLKLKQIGALRAAVANLEAPFDPTRLQAGLGKMINDPAIKPVQLALPDGPTVTISGQLPRDFDKGGYALKTPDGGELRTSAAVADHLHQLTKGQADHLMALSKVLTQNAPMGLMSGHDIPRKMIPDTQEATVEFGIERGQDGYSVTITHSVPVKGLRDDDGVALADPNVSSYRGQATVHIPFTAIANGGIDWNAVAFDQGRPPGFRFDFQETGRM